MAVESQSSANWAIFLSGGRICLKTLLEAAPCVSFSLDQAMFAWSNLLSRERAAVLLHPHTTFGDRKISVYSTANPTLYWIKTTQEKDIGQTCENEVVRLILVIFPVPSLEEPIKILQLTPQNETDWIVL
jgi:hypothetical protein